MENAAALPNGGNEIASTDLLTQLRAAHDELIQAIGEMEQVAGQSAADSPAFNAARFRIGRASLGRRMLWHKIDRHLTERVQGPDLQTVQLLREADAKLLRHSSTHVSRWTPQAVLSDWYEYREAAHAMRQHMRDNVETERKLLYPLLARYA